MNPNTLWHIAQQLDNFTPDIIYKGTDKLDPSRDKMERQQIVSKINEIILTAKRLSKSSNVTIYYMDTNRDFDFVIKTIPNEQDNYNRLAPILSYGNFPKIVEIDHKNEDWIENFTCSIKDFTSSINRTLNEDTLAMIVTGLNEARENLRKKRLKKEFAINSLMNIILLGVVIATPLTLARALQEQTPQLIQQEVQPQTSDQNHSVHKTNQTPQPNPQPMSNEGEQLIPQKILEKVIQKLIMQIAILIGITNALMLIILKLPLASLLIRKYKKKPDRTFIKD